MDKKSFAVGALIGSALLASIGATYSHELAAGRFQIVQTHYELIDNGATTEKSVPMKIDTVTGKTWAYSDASVGDSATGLVLVAGWQELNDKLETTKFGAKPGK